MNNSEKKVSSIFEKYQKERLSFAQAVSDLATRESNVEFLVNAGALNLLRPLLLDNIPPIQQAAANALAKIAQCNESIARDVVKLDILQHLTFRFSDQNVAWFHLQKSAASALRAISRHSAELAKSVIDQGGLAALVDCVNDNDPSMREAGIWGIGYIARHSAELAKKVIGTNISDQLTACLVENDLALKRVALSAISDISKHNGELAQYIVDLDAITKIAPLISHSDTKIRKQSLSCLCQVAKHSVDLAESVIDAEIFPNALICLKDVDAGVRKNAVTLLCEISKHSIELAQLIVNAGGIAPVVDFVNENSDLSILPGIMTLGYISAFSETLALAVIMAKGVRPIIQAISNNPSPSIKAAAAWVLGQIGRHTPEHARAVSENGGLSALVKIYKETTGGVNPDEEADIKAKAKRALKYVVEKTITFDALEPMLNVNTPLPILKGVVFQFSKILPNDVAMRRHFVTSGALQRLQEISVMAKKDPESASAQLDDLIAAINKCFPEEVIKYYSPGYSDTLLKKIESYSLKDTLEKAGVGSQSNLSKEGAVESITQGTSDAVPSM